MKSPGKLDSAYTSHKHITNKPIEDLDKDYNKLPFEVKVNRMSEKIESIIEESPTLKEKLEELSRFSIKELINLHYDDPEQLAGLCDPLDPEIIIAALQYLKRNQTIKKAA